MRPLIAAFALVVSLTLPVWAQGISDIQQSAEQGDVQAQFFLGSLYRDGQGVEKDLTETLKWWNEAARLGHVDAQFALGEIYAGGYGVARDYVRSYMWFDITAAQTATPWLAPIARSNRDALVDRMSPAEISKAREMAAEWIARHRQ